MRSLDDVKTWLSIEKTGTCETAAAPFWRLLPKYAPNTKIVTVRRPVVEVMESLGKLDVQHDEALLKSRLEHLDRKLDQIERRLPDVRSVQFSDLPQERVCASLFEHCLPYKHDPAWWRSLDDTNIQINYPALVRYVTAHMQDLVRLAAQAKLAITCDMAVKPVDLRSVTIKSESFDDFIKDCEPLIRRHCSLIGEHPDNWANKNIPLMGKLYDLGVMQIMVGRSNGRAFGYLMTIIAPSLEAHDCLEAQHAAFFAAEEMPGLGLKLQRAALTALKARGVHNTYMRAGIRGDGGRMDTLYRRLGGEDFGRMFRVGLAA